MRGERKVGGRFYFAIFLLVFLAIGVRSGAADEQDLDGDGLPDWWEERFVETGAFSLTRDDGDGDPDRDGLTNLREFEVGSHPLFPDSDGDSLADGDEVDRFGTLPAIADTDGGGCSDGAEVASRRSPLDPDDDASAGNAVFNLQLSRGWNLVSLPVTPPDDDIVRLLAPIQGQYNIVWGFIGDDWQSFDPDLPEFRTLTTLRPGRGYWIDMKTSATLAVSGPPATESVSLAAGWNLIGINFLGKIRAKSAFRDLGSQMSAAWMYSSGTWRVFDPQNSDFSDLQWLQAGYGYWIKTDRAGILRIP